MVIRRVQCLSLWDKDAVSTVLAGAKLAPGSAEFQEVRSQTSSSPSKEHCSIGLPMFVPSQPTLPTSSGGLQCSMCGATITSREQQVEHYRSPWHLHNLRRSTQGRSPVSQGQFDAQDEKDGSESSGSDGEDEEGSTDDDSTDVEESDSHALGRQPRLFFLNADGNVFSVYRNILLNKRAAVNSEQDAVQRLQAVLWKQRWAIFLLSGGHFAAAIFCGNKVEIRKTFHNYTVRAKQGGGQAGRDSQSGTSHPRSSGASLRRYNELSQRQHIQELLESWRPKLNTCDLIFCHAKRHGRPALFGGRQPILDHHDDRIRGIPFSTRRPKFAEVQRVHAALSEIFIHGTEEEFQNIVRESQEADKKPKPKPKGTSPKKSTKKLKFKSERRKDLEEEKEEEEEIDENNDGELDLVLRLRTISTDELGGGPACYMGKKDKRWTKNKKIPGEGMDVEGEPVNKEEEDNVLVKEMVCKKRDVAFLNQEGNIESPEGERDKERREEERSKSKKKGKKSAKTFGKAKECPHKLRVWDVLQSACKSGNLQHLATVLNKPPPVDQENTQGKALSAEVLASVELVKIPEELSEVRFGEKKFTMLHTAADSSQADVVWWLLCEDCDPSAGDVTGKMAYEVAADKNTRNVFRRFMAQKPQRYDYAKAKIPSPLTQAQEEEQAAKLAARRKSQRLAKAERQKEKKRKEREEEERRKEAEREEEEKRKFLLLSDREKRALAAERRFLQTQSAFTSSTPCQSRCFQCAKDISGIIPFEYSNNRFCSTTCVREHRTKPNP